VEGGITTHTDDRPSEEVNASPARPPRAFGPYFLGKPLITQWYILYLCYSNENLSTSLQNS